MPASKKLVYLPTVNPMTWLLMTKVEQGTCLRDYSTSPATPNRSYPLRTLENLIAQDGSYSERLPAFSRIPYSDEEFWREQIAFRNAESGLSSTIDERRLQERFKTECNKALNQRRSDEALWAVFEAWIDRFRCVKEKKQFNHWDNDVADSKFSATTGIGWTSQLLEASRKDGAIHFIPTGCEVTEFSLVAMELGLGISSKENRFRKGYTDFIKPDGLALRRNGYFSVIEVKGPQDEKGLIGPMLQGICAALALVANRAMIQRIVTQKADRRPAYPRGEIPIQRRTLGVHVLSYAAEDGGPRTQWTEEVEKTCSAVIRAFRCLEYVAFSFITANEATNLIRLKTNYLVTTTGVEKLH